MKKFTAEFKKFIMRGNIVDMAVGVIVGSSFTAIVNALSNNIPAPARALLDGRTSPKRVCITASMVGEDSISTSYTPLDAVLSTPIPEVEFAWGSKSHIRTFLPWLVKAAVKFTQVVVLPTPPF